MNFEDFVELADMDRSDYKEKLKERAKNLPLNSIIECLDLDDLGDTIAREGNYQFEKGNSISFSIHPITCSCSISASPNKITLSRDNLEIRQYTGKDVVNLYNKLSDKIKEAIEWHQDIPF